LHPDAPELSSHKLDGMAVRPQSACLLLALPFFGCVPNVQPGFEYTNTIRDTVALPILKRELGDVVKYYDPNKPTIHLNPKNSSVVTLFFAWDFMKNNGLEVLDPPYVSITLNWRTLEVCDQGSFPSYIIVADEEATKQDAALALRCR
jgi:hypothetical protein